MSHYSIKSALSSTTLRNFSWQVLPLASQHWPHLNPCSGLQRWVLTNAQVPSRSSPVSHLPCPCLNLTCLCHCQNQNPVLFRAALHNLYDCTAFPVVGLASAGLRCCIWSWDPADPGSSELPTRSSLLQAWLPLLAIHSSCACSVNTNTPPTQSQLMGWLAAHS